MPEQTDQGPQSDPANPPEAVNAARAWLSC